MQRVEAFLRCRYPACKSSRIPAIGLKRIRFSEQARFRRMMIGIVERGVLEGGAGMAVAGRVEIEQLGIGQLAGIAECFCALESRAKCCLGSGGFGSGRCRRHRNGAAVNRFCCRWRRPLYGSGGRRSRDFAGLFDLGDYAARLLGAFRAGDRCHRRRAVVAIAGAEKDDSSEQDRHDSDGAHNTLPIHMPTLLSLASLR
jgi:hypothetical protein